MVRELWLARHAESVGNVAATRAEAECLEVIPLDIRDADVGLSSTGVEQATPSATGCSRGFPSSTRCGARHMPERARPSPPRSASSTAIGWCSPMSGCAIGSWACSTC